jgi:hypothetical protein
MNYQFPMHVHQGLAAWHEVGKDRLWTGCGTASYMRPSWKPLFNVGLA